MTIHTIKDISTDTLFQDVFEAEGLVLLLFCAKWWQPCKEIEKNLKSLDSHFHLTIYKIDFNKHYDLCKEFQIISIPALVFFRDGTEQARLTGAQDKEEIEKFIDSVL